MKYTVKILVLLGVFIASIYFFGSNMDEVMFGTMKAKTTMAAEAELPTIGILSDGVKVNCLYGYTSALDMFSMRENLVAMQEEQTLELLIQENSTDVRKLHYKVKSVNTKDEVAEGKINAFNTETEQKKARIKIATKLKDGEEYAVELMLVDSESRRIYYYFRIKYYANCYFAEEVSFMQDFSTWAREKNESALLRYLESTYKGKGTTYAKVTIKDSAYMVCWGDLQPRLLTEPVLTIAEVYSNIAIGVLSYMVELDTDSGVEQYYVTEKFRVKMTSSSKYLLNYERNMEALFNPNLASLSQNQFKVGITNELQTEFLINSDASMLVFIRNNELWQYNMAENQLSKVFSFRSEKEAKEGISCDQYNINVLKLYENGDISFMVYGYMGKGEHEGRTGVLVYRYYRTEKRIEEQLYLPISKSYQEMKEKMGSFNYMNEYDEVYFTINSVIYSYNFTTKKLNVISENIREDKVYFFEQSSYIAWQEDYTKVKLLYLETGEKQEILAQEGEFIRILDKINDNIICGYGKLDDCQVSNDGTMVYPAKLVKILDAQLQERKTYEKEEVYVIDAQVNGGAICLSRAVKNTSSGYKEIAQDYILHSIEEKKQQVKLEKRATDLMFTEYYIDLPTAYEMGELPTVENIPYTLISEDTTARILDWNTQEEYKVYSFGKIIRVYEDCAEAIALANTLETVGTVLNEEGKIIWERGVKPSSYSLKEPKILPLKESGLNSLQDAVRVMAEYMSLEINASALTPEKNIKEFLEEATGNTIIALKKAMLDEVLYFVYKEAPVFAMKNEKEAVVIIGYTANSVLFYEDGKVKTISFSNAETMFSKAGNIFFSYKK